MTARHTKVLIIGFGRFGQIASQPLLALRHSVSIIDNDTEMVKAAAEFGFKVHYGDGTRLDILHAAGAGTADIILVCTDKKEQTLKIVELLHHEFPLARVMARAFDRVHAIELVRAGADYQQRELLEAAFLFGSEAIRMLGEDEQTIADVLEGVRDRDRQRFELQMSSDDWHTGGQLLLSNAREQAREGGVDVDQPVPQSQGS